MNSLKMKLPGHIPCLTISMEQSVISETTDVAQASVLAESPTRMALLLLYTPCPTGQNGLRPTVEET